MAFSPQDSQLRSKKPLYNLKILLRRAVNVKYTLRARAVDRQKNNYAMDRALSAT